MHALEQAEKARKTRVLDQPPSPRYARLIMLPQIRIASPCPADWNQMSGDAQVRFCSLCQLNVYNFSAMSAQEIEKLLADNQGRRVCARFYAREDGTMLLQDCPVGFRARVHRASRWAGAALSAMMSVGYAAAQNIPANPPDLLEMQPGQGKIAVNVTDASGAVIQNAKVTLEDASNRNVVQGSTDARGNYPALLAPGLYTLRVDRAGFAPWQQSIEIRSGNVSDVAPSLTLAQMITGGDVMGVIVDPVVQPVPYAADTSAIPNSLPSSSEPAPSPVRPPGDRQSRFSRFFHKLGF